jgi:hypothetical protein
MSVLRLSAGGVSFRHRPCVAGHGPGIRVVTKITKIFILNSKKKSQSQSSFNRTVSHMKLVS